MPETILLALILSKCKKYQIKPLFESKEIYYVLFIELIYIAAQIALFAGNYTFIRYAGVLKSIYLCSYLGLVFKHELYKQAIIGSGFVVLGGICNDIAIAANGGKMPVFPSLSYWTGYISREGFETAIRVTNDFHVIGNQETKLKVFTDIFDIGYGVLSIGDIFIRAFVMLIIYGAIKQFNIPNKGIETYM